VNQNWIHLQRVISTNSYLNELLKAGKGVEGTVVMADYQEHGRGQGGNGWVSEPGSNLLMSLLLFPAFLSASAQFSLSIAASLAVCDTLLANGLDPLIKWPNDIVTSRGKISGILIENGIMGGQLSHSIIGIGLNVHQVRFPAFPLKATSMAAEGAGYQHLDHLAHMLAGKVMERYRQLKEEGDARLRPAYLELLFMKDKSCTFDTGGSEMEGVIRGISTFGELLVETAGTVRPYGMHAIRLKLPGSPGR
jgi:BirA family biotin operon repressor/biotin-[acetyl-CoA-carboxylase] ligase